MFQIRIRTRSCQILYLLPCYRHWNVCRFLHSGKKIFTSETKSIFLFVFIVFQIACLESAAERQTHKLRQSYFKAVLRQEIAWFDEQQSGEVASRLTEFVIRFLIIKNFYTISFSIWISFIIPLKNIAQTHVWKHDRLRFVVFNFL